MKCLPVVANALMAICLLLTASNCTLAAAWVTPTIYDHSPDQGGATVDLLVDGDTTNLAKLIDDSPPADDTDFIISGYVVFDLGIKQKVEGWKYWSRNHAADLGPKDVAFFYWNNENLNAHAFIPNTHDQIALDPNVVIAATRSLPGVNLNNSYELTFTTEEQFEARYVGLCIYTGYDTPPNAAIHMAEVQLYTTGLLWRPGDTNRDGAVNAADAIILAENWLKGTVGSKAFVHQTIASGVSAGETYSVSFDATGWVNPSTMTADLYYDDDGAWTPVSDAPRIYTFEGSEQLETYTFDWTAEAGEAYLGKTLVIGFGIDGEDGAALYAARVVDNVSVTKNGVELVTNGDFSATSLNPWEVEVTDDYVQAFKDTWGLPSDPTLTMRIVGEDEELSWSDGDFNGDGMVNDIDATLMAANWTGSAASAPEPSALAAILTLLLWMLFFRRGR